MSETKGRCYNETKASRDFSTDHLVIADAIDRLAADVAAVKEMTQEIALRVPSEFGQDACDVAVRVLEKERDAAIRLRDEARAEVERLRAIVHSDAGHMARILIENERLRAEHAAPQPAGHGISPGLPETQSAGNAAPPAGWLTDEERRALSRAFDLLCDDDGDSPLAGTVQALLARAGSPPVVEVPALGLAAYRFDSPFSSGEYRAGYREACFAHRAAMDKAGVPWKEVPRE